MNNTVKIFEVYKVTNTINGKVYVGITNQTFKVRWYKHCSDSLRGSEFPLHNAIRKYGVDNFTIELLEICDTLEQLKEREKFWIIELQSKVDKNGYNLTDGGDGTFGKKLSEETKDKIRQKALGRVVSEEVKDNLRKRSPFRKEVKMFDLQGNYIQTFESCTSAAKFVNGKANHIADVARGKANKAYNYKWSYTGEITKQEEVKPIVTQVVKTKRVTSEETKLKLSISNKENWTEEKRKQSSLNNPKNHPILQYTLDGEFVKEYYNVSDAARSVGASTHTNIAKCARGIRKKACGFVWRYKTA